MILCLLYYIVLSCCFIMFSTKEATIVLVCGTHVATSCLADGVLVAARGVCTLARWLVLGSGFSLEDVLYCIVVCTRQLHQVVKRRNAFG
jgi:hypothetical protein